jgi:hypothetical protein
VNRGCSVERDPTVIETRRIWQAWDQVQQEPVDGLDGDRQIGGASLAQAFIRNMVTWRSDAKGLTRAETPQGFEYRGGAQGRTDS